MFHKKIHLIWALLIGWLSVISAFAAQPDLTGSGVIAGIDRTNTYNLGATGLRGWIWVDRSNKGEVGLITDPSRQILVTHCGAPANAVLAVDDVILGAIAASSGTVPDFTSDCRKAFASAITGAEKTGAGTLRVKRWRAGVTTEQNITLPILGNYSATAPFSCPKSALILDNVRNKMVANLLANPNYLTGGFGGSSNALALLSGVKPGDPDYDAVQTRLQTYARAQAAAGAVNEGLSIWSWSYTLIFLSEYYLLTGDAQVVSGIQDYTLTLAGAQSIYGTYGHGPSAVRPDGSGRLYSTGYGPVNAVGGTAAIALVMGKKALVAAGQTIAPEIDAAIQRSSSFFAFYVNKGCIPYGEHEPVITYHASNGKDAMPAVFFGLQTGRAVETEYFSRISVAGWIGREYGHTGQGLSYFWTTLGALMGGPDAASEHLKQVRWHLDLSRRTDGSFAYDGQEQYGPGTTSDNTYLGVAEYGGMTADAMYLLTYSLPLQRLWITGKSANPAYTLNSTKIASAVAAGSFRLDRSTKSISELLTAIGDYDPLVRNYASIELASRTLSGTDLTNLRNLLSSTDPNLRQSACQTLGILQDSTSLPTIVARLNDPDLWVRAKAAIATRAYSSADASTHRDSIMSSFIANATDPDVINWSDPIQICNGKLGNAIFGQGVQDSAPANDIASYTINAPKQTLLYPALRAGLKQPDSYARLSATLFCRLNLPLVDAQAVYPEVANAAEFDTPADRMWSGACRRDAITMLADLKIAEGIPLALATLESAPGFEWGEGYPRIGALNALASYGEAARYTLPTLRAYLNQWAPTAEEYPELVSTINAIENAITAPAQELGLCVANPQVVTTTGSTAITLTGASPRGPFTYLNVTQPAHGTITGTAPDLTYTPTGGYTGPDQFTFQTTDTLTTSTVTTVGIVVGPSGNGLQGEYFNNSDFTSPVLPRIDPQINFDWGTGSPHVSIGPDTFSVRWSGVLLVPQSGTYTFSALTSDGVRLYINGNLVIDRFIDQSTRWTDSNPVYLTAGQYADIYLEYYENTGSAVAKLKWTGPGFAGANGNFIPQTYLFDGSGISNRPVYAFSQNLTTNLNTALPITLSGTGGTLTYTVLTQPANGTLSGTPPYLTYAPNSNFSGADSFTFLVNNGSKNSLPATVSINVQAGPLTSFTWAGAVSGNWNDGTKWTPGLPAAAGLPTYALNFTAPGTYTATHNLNNGFQLNQLNAAVNVTLAGTQGVAFAANGGSLPQFNQNGANEVRVDHPVSLQSTTTLGGSGGARIILNGVISGNGGLVKNNTGILQIGQLTNSYSGGTVLNAGTVEMSPGEGGLTPALGSGTVTLNQGAVLSVNRTNLANNMIFNGGTVTGGNSFSSVFSGSITLNGIVTFDFGTTGGFEITGNMSGSGGFTYTGPFNAWSEFPCSGTNTHTGPTTVLSGTLSFPSINSVPPGPMILSGDSKLKLNFTGTRVIESFTLNGVLMPPGTYGSTTSPATNKDDTNFTGNGTLTVLQPTATSLNLTTGSSPANPGALLTFTATVTGSAPTGNVQFYSGSTLLGTDALNGSYQATVITNQLAVGSNNITARYVGNVSNSPSTSSPVVVVINSAPAAAPEFLNATPADPSINLNWTASAGATSYYLKRSTTNGGPYTVFAFVTGTSYQDSAILNGVPYYYVVSALNVAGESPNSIQASAYTGSLTATTTTLASSPVATGVYGTSVTFTATVTSSSGTPTGTVTFRSGSNVIGSGTLSAGTASLVISTLATTTHSITASYAGSLDPSSSSILSYQVTQKPLTLSGVTAANKVYDGTPAATFSGGSLSGVIGGDTVNIVPGYGTFANANTGNWAVTATSYSLGGTHAANYTLSAQPTVPNATISARPIHITGTKTYDGTTAALNGILTIANNVDGGNLSLTGSAALSGKDAGNQTIINSTAPIAHVQTAPPVGTTTNNSLSTSITATLPAAPANGNTLIAVISTRNTSTNQVSSITGGGVTWTRVSQAANASGSTVEIWVGPDVSSGGSAITINHAANRSSAVVLEYSGLMASSSFLVANNNTSTGTSATTSSVTYNQATELWIGGIGANSGSPTISSLLNTFTNEGEASSSGGAASGNTKVFALQRTVTSSLTAAAGGTLSASLSWSGAIATFRAAGSLSLTGSAAANYSLTDMTSSVTVNPKPLTITGLTASDKTYDGTTAATLSGTGALLTAQAPGAGTTSDGIPYTGDTITLGGTPTGGSFATKHVGTAKSVTGVTGLTLSGAQAGNYTLVPVSTLSANVTQLAVTVAAVTATKTYDRTTTSSGTPTITPALASGDSTTVLSQSYQSASAGVSNKTLIPSITIDDGNGGNNYTVNLTTFTTGTITQKNITVAAVNATKTYDGTTTAPGTPAITPALASGDTTSALSQSFATATAGISNKVIIPAITINDGDGGNNYAVELANFTTGTIHKATATVAFGNLSQTFTNTPKSVSVTTNPPGLANAVTYNGSSSEPINADTYAVVATVNDANYSGSAIGSLIISYDVIYNGNGNTSGSVPWNQAKLQNVSLTLATNSGNLAKTGFTFVGWNTSADGGGTDYTGGGTYIGNASITLHAKWAAGTNGTWLPTAAGPFNWGDTANWLNGTIANGADVTAFFTPDIAAAQVVNLDAPRAIGNITFTDSTTDSHHLTISGANILTLSRSPSLPVIDVTQSARTLTITSVIEGTNGLQKNGPGTLLLNAISPSFSGNLTISAGTLRIGDNNSPARLGAATYTGNVSNNGTLWFTHNQNQEFTGIISGTGTLNKGGSGMLTLSGTSTYTGKTIIAGSGGGGPSLSVSSFNSVNGGTPTMTSSSIGAPTTEANGTIQLGSGTNFRSCSLIYTGPGETTDRVMNVQFNSGAKHTISNNGGGMLKFTSDFTITPSTGSTFGGLTLGGAGNGQVARIGTLPGILEKAGNGRWIVNGSNVSNSAVVTGGTLLINGTLDTTTTLSISANATLGGTGTIGGNTTIAASGKLEFNLSTAAGSHNPLDLIAGKALTLSGTSVLTITSTGGAAPGTYTLITGGNNIIGSAPATLNLPANWAATVSISGNSLLLHVTSTGATYPVTYNGNDATSGTVPSDQTKNPDVSLTLATNSGNLARAGYAFAGWNTQANGLGASYAEGTSYTANAALTLYAEWTMLPYTAWAMGTFANPFSDTALISNPDGDGFKNLLEYAFGMDPTSAISGPLVYATGGDVTTAGSPILRDFAAVGQPEDFKAVFARRKNHIAAGLTYTVQFSADLSLWTASATAPTLQTGLVSSGDMEAVSVPFTPTVPLQAGGSAPPTFFRIVISSN